MKKYIALIDCDDTIYECNKPAIERLNKEYPEAPALSMEDIVSWGLVGTRVDERTKYFSMPEFVATQPLIDGAKEFIYALSQMAEVYFLSSVPAEVLSARAKRLQQDFPFIPADRIMLASAKHLVRADFLLDDAPHNIFDSVAEYPVLFRRPWNRNVTGIMSVNNYDDFLSFVKQVINGPTKRQSIKNGGVLALIGPSGSRKQELVDALCENEGFKRVVPYTTKSDANTAYYHTVTDKDFFEADYSGSLLEKSAYGGHYYGIPKGSVSEIAGSGKVAVLAVDICGAVTLRNLYPTVFVYVKRDKERIIRELLTEEMSVDEKVKRILSVEREKLNEPLCDFTVNADENPIDAILRSI